MSRDPHLAGLVTVRQQERTTNALQRVGVLERRTVGGSGTGTVADATTTSKGKLQLAGHLAGTADVPIIATTAEPQVARFSVGATAATSPFALYIRATDTLKGTYIADYGSTFDFDGLNSVIRLANASTNATSLALTGRRSNFYSRMVMRGAGQVSAGGWLSIWAQQADDSGVQSKAITSIAADGTVTLASHTFVAGERVLVYGTTGTASHNDEWVVQSVPDTTHIVLGPSFPGGTSTGGTVNNAPFYSGIVSGVQPSVDRSVLSGGGANGDDVSCFSAKNSGTGRGTDAFYLGASDNVTGSGWISGYTMDSDVDFGFRVGAVTIGADSSLAAFNEPFGAAFDCSNTTFVAGADPIRINNGGRIASKNAAGSGYVRMLSVNSSDQICIGDFGTNNALLFFRNNSLVFSINSSLHTEWADGKRIGLGANPAAALTLGYSGAAATTTAAFGIDFGGDTNLYRGAADVLRTDDNFGINQSAGGAPAAAAGGWYFTNGGAANSYRTTAGVILRNYMATGAGADAQPKFRISSTTNGADIEWGPGGSTAPDVNLFRTSGGALRTDDAMEIGGTLTTSGASSLTGQTTVGGPLIVSNATASGYLQTTAQSSAPAAPSSQQGRIYFRGDKIVIAFNNGTNTQYLTCDLSSSGATNVWAVSTTAP